MYNEAVEKRSELLNQVLDQFVTQEMWPEVVQSAPEVFKHVLYQFVQLQEMCNKALQSDPEVVLRWYKGYEQRKAQKAKIKRRVNACCMASGSMVELVCT